MKKSVSIILVIALAFSALSLQAFAASSDTSSIEIALSTDKSSYLFTGNATINVSIKNISSEPVYDVTVNNLIPGLFLIISGKENISYTLESLEPGGEVTKTFKVCLNPQKANINFVDKIILSLKVLFMKIIGTTIVESPGYGNVYDDGFSELITGEQGILFGNWTLWHSVRVQYLKNAVSVGTVEEIVAAYNLAANATKAYKERITITDSGGVTSVINKITGGIAVAKRAEKMLPNFRWGPYLETFVDGKSMRHDYSTLANSLPVFGEAYMSILESAGVSKALRISEGTGWKYKIILSPETVDSLDGIPKYRAQCMDYLELDERDLEPFKLKSVAVKYTEATITAYANADGLLEKLHFVIPADIVGEFSYGIINVDVDITGTTTENYLFTYDQ